MDPAQSTEVGWRAQCRRTRAVVLRETI